MIDARNEDMFIISTVTARATGQTAGMLPTPTLLGESVLYRHPLNEPIVEGLLQRALTKRKSTNVALHLVFCDSIDVNLFAPKEDKRDQRTWQDAERHLQ